jgi:hypothetical protein
LKSFSSKDLKALILGTTKARKIKQNSQLEQTKEETLQ